MQLANKCLFSVLSVACASNCPGAARCTLEVPVYDSTGNRLPARIAEVRAKGREVNLLNAGIGFQLGSEGTTLHFPANAIQREITVIAVAGTVTKHMHVVLVSCRQRQSFQDGERSTNADVFVSEATGRITGCALKGDWWIRLIPMFGGHEGLNHEGWIDRSTGRFAIVSSFRGERHIAAIGRDSVVVHSVGVNVISGATTNLGDINLSGKCP